VAPVVTAAGYDLEDLSVSRAGRRYVVRVIVDGDGGVDLDAVAALSREMSAALDAAEASGGELTPGEYTLEVSSPGVDRPLTQVRHWRRNIGRLVKAVAGGQQITGRVTAVDDARVELDVAGERVVVPHAELGPGRVQLEFSRLDELGDGELGDGTRDGRADEEDGAEEEEDEE
jgi:ribosome maturation factor RimP